MDIEKLIEQLNDFNENHIAVLCGSGQCACGYLCDKDDCIVVRAATALSTLQAENEKLRDELERVKRECDAATEDLRVCSIENYMECRYCLYRTARSFCRDCTDGSNWQWRDPRKEN